MKVRDSDICYYCGAKAVDGEHVPPFCFFPEGKRKQLLTVPSCFLHNNMYSDDDDYVRNILTMEISCNRTGKKLYYDKSHRSFKRNPKDVEYINKRAVDITLINGTKTGAIGLDVNKFNNVMRKIGYGLFFLKYNRIWKKPLNIYCPNLLDKRSLVSPLGKLFKKVYKDFSWAKSYGENIDVFTYKWGKDNKDNIMLRLRFYDKILVYIFETVFNK